MRGPRFIQVEPPLKVRPVAAPPRDVQNFHHDLGHVDLVVHCLSVIHREALRQGFEATPLLKAPMRACLSFKLGST
jgi:hypothetical protein